MNAKNPMGALPLALSFTALYLVVAGGAGYLTLDARASAPTTETTAAAAPQLPVITTTPPSAQPSEPSTQPVPPTTTTIDVPPDFRPVEAPGGLTTAIPAAWPVTNGTVATTLVATDPTDPRREVRLGGAPVGDPSKPLLDRITEAAADREQESGHRRLALAAAMIRNHPAVGWEFEENAAGGPKRVATAYWEVNGVEYVLYAAGPPDQWEATRALLATMSTLARP